MSNLTEFSSGRNGLLRQPSGALVTDLLFGFYLLLSTVPEVLTGDQRIAGIPFEFLFFYASLIASFVSSILNGSFHFNKYLVGSLIAALYMALVGFLGENDFRFWIIDITNFSGLIFGIYWASNRNAKYIGNVLQKICILISVILILNLLGLLFGLISPSNAGSRLYTYSLFVSSGFIIVAFPVWIASSYSQQANRAAFNRAPYLAITGISAVLAGSILSASKTLFLATIVSVVLVLWIQLESRQAIRWATLAILGFLALMLLGFDFDAWRSSSLADRFLSYDIREGARYLELELMFRDLGDRLLTGTGFGSRFVSVVYAGGDFLAYTTHIGIVTLLYKGGIFIFVIWIIMPVALAIRACLRTRSSRNRFHMSCNAGVISFAVLSSMSGGWTVIAMFLFGALAMLAHRTSPRNQNIRPHKTSRANPANWRLA